MDESRHGLRFDSPHFPAYLRLFKWKILDICVRRTSDDAFGEFLPLFGEKELKNFIAYIRNPESLIKIQNPDMGLPQLNVEKYIHEDIFDEEKFNLAKRKRQFLIQVMMKNEVKIVRKRYIERFFSQVFYCEEGLRIADQLIKKYNRQLYKQLHWEGCPPNWPSARIFFERFYDTENRYMPQKLDRVVTASRGNLIFNFWRNSQLYEREMKAIDCFLKDPNIGIESQVIQDVLDEGPFNIIELNPQGDEIVRPIEKWNKHKYFNLIEAMSHDSHNRAGLWFLHPNWEETLQEKEKERQRMRMLLSKGIGAEGADKLVDEREIREMRPQPQTNVEIDDEIECDELKLRSYQEELVLPALNGENVVIVAPTGSGKTEVAIYAALTHIEAREAKNQPSRVVMLVPKIPLVEQQRDRFLKYCFGKYHVEGFHGSEKSSDGRGRKDEVIKSHVVIMTPQILLNMWQSVRESERLYVCDFSMVIFDEVHKTTGNHPYCEIAQIISSYNGVKPQIIGLTASLNVKTTGKNDHEQMLGEIYKLLAILEATCLSTIQNEESLRELNRHVSRPDDNIIMCPPPPDQKAKIRGYIKRSLKMLHEKLLTELDRLFRGRGGNFLPANFLKRAKMLNLDDVAHYEAWLQSVVQHLNKLHTPDKHIAQINAKYLRVIVEARAIVEVMPAYVAFEYMDEKFQELKSSGNFQQFSGDFDKNRETLDTLKNSDEDNADPQIVKELKNTLIAQFRAIPDSRVIIFVTQRATAKNVCMFLNKSGVFEKSNSVGYVLGTNNQGSVSQSQTEQKRTIEMFNNGKLKAIVATSVVEEGLDVAACNLIIKYNCSSGSAVQLTQQRGRARAKNSRSVLLVAYSKVKENENNALISEKNMRACVKEIQKNGKKHLMARVAEERKRLERLREQELREKENKERELQNKLYTVACSKCSLEFCKSTSIKKIFSNYIVIDPDIWDKFELEPRRSSKYIDENLQPLCTLKCAKCRSDAGRAFKQRGVYVPHIDVKILAFHEENAVHAQMETKGKWTNVENELFFIGDARECHFKMMLNALDNNEKNLEKKRLLDFESRNQSELILRKVRLAKSQREAEETRIAERRQLAPDNNDDEMADSDNENTPYVY
ncbi:unnamed protein product [Caenorhabditis bovis]|uniref:RNA helicase n=1 Tax=Caenorhabditis bovis TaxID=2654633 RepID=A0A8S1FBA6_9PELO|nr:unnamed protein product [Caenorhabditis bovis]